MRAVRQGNLNGLILRLEVAQQDSRVRERLDPLLVEQLVDGGISVEVISGIYGVRHVLRIQNSWTVSSVAAPKSAQCEELSCVD
jgi:hypothetical protein